jgi:virginiamycin B lyase
MSQVMDRQTSPRRWRRQSLPLVVALGIAISVAAIVWRIGPPWASWGFQEFRLPNQGDIPVGIAVGPDGTVWFTLESSDAIGLFRNGQIQKLSKGTESVEPLGLAVDAGGQVWYTEAPRQRISRASPDGSITSFGLATPVARLGRLAVAPDGDVWFAEPSVVSVTRLRDGQLTRHVVRLTHLHGAMDAGPFGVAVAADRTVWATLQNANKLLRLAPDGQMATFDVPTRRSGLGDIAADGVGAVWFLEIGANKIGRFAGGQFDEFTVPTPSAGLTALAVAPDGAVWFTELRAHCLGRLHGGTITEFALPRGDARPFGIAVDAGNNVWYTDLSGWLGRLDASRARVR